MTFPFGRYRKECLSELAGTYLLVLLGPSSIIIASRELDALRALFFVAFCFGGTVALVILLLGRYSAHINPAVTFAHGLANLTRREALILFIGFQLTGALLAGLTLRMVFGPSGLVDSLGSTKLAAGVTPFDGFLLEFVGTFFLSSSAILASGHVRGSAKQAALVGTTLFVLIILIGPFTGAGFNPARSLGPSLASGYLSNQEVYWAGPLAGAALAGFTYAAIRDQRARKLRTRPSPNAMQDIEVNS